MLIDRAEEAYKRARREVFDLLAKDTTHITAHQRQILAELASAEHELTAFRERRRHAHLTGSSADTGDGEGHLVQER